MSVFVVKNTKGADMPTILSSASASAGDERPVDQPPATGRGFYSDAPVDDTRPVLLAIIIVGLAGTIGVSLFFMAVFVGWV